MTTGVIIGLLQPSSASQHGETDNMIRTSNSSSEGGMGELRLRANAVLLDR